MDDFDYSAPESHTSAPDKRVLIEEHPIGPNEPVSYMAYSNCTNAMHEITEIMELMNLCDDLPQWVDQLIAEGADRFAKAKSYILSQKEANPETVVSYDHDSHSGHPTSQTFDYAPQSIGVPMAPTMVTPMNDFEDYEF
jgi:hypothetical protein